MPAASPAAPASRRPSGHFGLSSCACPARSSAPAPCGQGPGRLRLRGPAVRWDASPAGRVSGPASGKAGGREGDSLWLDRRRVRRLVEGRIPPSWPTERRSFPGRSSGRRGLGRAFKADGKKKPTACTPGRMAYAWRRHASGRPGGGAPQEPSTPRRSP